MQNEALAELFKIKHRQKSWKSIFVEKNRRWKIWICFEYSQRIHQRGIFTSVEIN